MRRVKRFVEKPNQSTANEYVASGDYLWNPGVFVWRNTALLEAFARHLPDIFATLDVPVSTVDQVYPNARRETIDVGIMEQARNVATIPSDFGWSDIGSWAELWQLAERDGDDNVWRGDGRVLAAESKRNLVFAEGRSVALVGVEDLVVVETADAIFICPRERAQDVKLIVQRLQREGETGAALGRAGLSLLPPPPNGHSLRKSPICQLTSSMLATKIDEYVPVPMPISRASTNVKIVEPPKSSSTTSVSSTVNDVFSERVSVWARLWLTTSSKVSPGRRMKFSRMRSNTTMVSWTEKPMTVSTATMKVVFDRIRENFIRRSGESFENVVNHRLAQTMTRSLNTSLDGDSDAGGADAVRRRHDLARSCWRC